MLRNSECTWSRPGDFCFSNRIKHPAAPWWERTRERTGRWLMDKYLLDLRIHLWTFPLPVLNYYGSNGVSERRTRIWFADFPMRQLIVDQALRLECVMSTLSTVSSHLERLICTKHLHDHLAFCWFLVNVNIVKVFQDHFTISTPSGNVLITSKLGEERRSWSWKHLGKGCVQLGFRWERQVLERVMNNNKWCYCWVPSTCGMAM